MSFLTDLLKKTGGSIKDAFVYTDAERESGKKPTILEKIPMRASETRDNVGAFFTPQPIEDGIRVRDVVRETPGAVGDVAKEIAQGTARSFDFVGRKGLDAIFGKYGPTAQLKADPESSKAEDFLFGGREKRSSNLSEVGETELGLDAEKRPILTPLAGLGIVGLDMVPGGQGKGKGVMQFFKSLTDDAVETLAKMTDDVQIDTFIRQSAPKLTDSEVTTLTKTIKNSNTPDEVLKNVSSVVDPKRTPVNKFKTKAEADSVVTKFSDQIAERQARLAEAKASSVPSATRVKSITDDISNLKLAQREARLDSFNIKEVPKAKTPVVEKTPETSPIEEVFVRPAEQIQEQIDQEMLMREFIQESLDQNEASTIVKYMGKGDNSIAEMQVRGEARGLKGAGLDDKITELGFRDMDHAQDALEGYQRDKMRLNEINESIRELRVDLKKANTQTVDDVIPVENQKKIAKALDEATTETKKLSPRRLKDAKKYGISEDVMGRVLHAKAGGRLTHEEASNLAETINAPMRDLLEKAPTTFQLSRPKIEAYSQELEGYFQHVVKDLKAQHEAFPKDKTLREQYQEASRTYMKARTTLEAVISEAGRVVEGSKVIGKYSRLPGMDKKIKKVREQITRYSERNPKHADLPTEFDMALETVDVNNATQLLDFLTQWNRSSFLQKLSEFQKASMLSAFSTHAVNALGNVIQQVLDVPVRILAGGLDTVRAGVTRTPRTVYAGESLAQVRGAMRAMPSAIERAVKALGNEHYALELRRTEIEAGTVVPAIRGKFGKVVRLPFRLLQSSDLGFRTAKGGAETDALAYRIAKKEGVKGKAFNRRVAELKENLPADMLDLVDERVERSLMLEELTGMLKSVENLKNEYPIMQFVIPFYRTLVNLSREAYRMTPIGGVGRTIGKLTPGQPGRNIEHAFNNKWTANDNTRMEELSRQIIGTTIMAWVVTNMLNGDVEITGPAPKSAGDREVFYGQGKLPHSIRVGDKWIEFQRVQPIGQLLQIGSSISEGIEAYKNTGQLSSAEVEKEVFNSISDIGNMVFTQSPFTGVSDFFDLVKGGAYNEGYLQAGNRYMGQMIGTFIPNILRRLTVAGDPIIYEKRDLESQLKSRVPGLQTDLTPRRDVFGEKVVQGGTFMSRFASPIRTNTAKENKLYDEMAEIKYTPSVPQRSAFNEDLSVKEYEALELFYGPRFRDELWAVVNAPSYKTLLPEQKRDMMSSVSRKVLSLAKQELFPIYAEKDLMRKQWEAEGYTPAVIEDALKAKYPYEKEVLEQYAQAILEKNIESGEARNTVEQLLKQ